MSLPPYACHNRKPFQIVVTVQDGWIELAGTRVPDMKRIPFRNSPDCHYSTSNLGQVDSRCEGCKWRHGVTAGAAQADTEST